MSSTYLGAQPASWVVLEGGKTCRTRSAGLAVVHNHRQEADERETNLLGFFCCWYHKCETHVNPVPDHHHHPTVQRPSLWKTSESLFTTHIFHWCRAAGLYQHIATTLKLSSDISFFPCSTGILSYCLCLIFTSCV